MRTVMAGFCGIAVLVCAPSVMADGAHWPEAAYPTMPKIPMQRAIIVYRDGIETLVVESAFDSPSPGIGWVIPIPAEPTKIEVADSGMLISLAMCLRPEITHDISLLLSGALLVFVVTAAVAAIVILTRELEWRVRRLAMLAICLFLLSLVAGIMAPASLHFGGAGSGTIAEVRSSQRVGSYNASVLRASESGAVSRWLTENGLKPLDAAAATIVDRYIADRWCFVVARLRREGGGTAAPHPLKVTFPSSMPIYPMRLTALAESTTRVELFVIAESQAWAASFHCASADGYGPTLRRKLVPGDWQNAARYPPYYKALMTGQKIGSPDVCELMWGGCVVTRLVRDVSPEQMRRDIEIKEGPLAPHRDHAFSARGRRGVAYLVLLLGGTTVLAFLALACRGMRRPVGQEVVVFSVVAALTIIGAAGVRLLVPAIEVATGSKAHPGLFAMDVHERAEEVRLMAAYGDLHDAMTPSELAKAAAQIKTYRESPDQRGRNLLTGEDMRCERSPGNYSVRKVGDKTYFCLYDLDCRETRVELRSKRAATEQETERKDDPAIHE